MNGGGLAAGWRLAATATRDPHRGSENPFFSAVCTREAYARAQPKHGGARTHLTAGVRASLAGRTWVTSIRLVAENRCRGEKMEYAEKIRDVAKIE